MTSRRKTRTSGATSSLKRMIWVCAWTSNYGRTVTGNVSSRTKQERRSRRQEETEALARPRCRPKNSRTFLATTLRMTARTGWTKDF